MNYNKADFIASYGISSQLPESDRPELSFSGRSNVGKSSLINKLCNRKNLARVSSTPGKTATINFYAVDDCYFVDLPGYGYAKVSNADRERWDDLINSYFEAQRHHTLLVQLIDCRHAPSADDIQMLHYLHYHNIPFVVALTKADKLKKSQLAQTQEEFESSACLRLPEGGADQRRERLRHPGAAGCAERSRRRRVRGKRRGRGVTQWLTTNLLIFTMSSTARPTTRPSMPTSKKSWKPTVSMTASSPTWAAGQEN